VEDMNVGCKPYKKGDKLIIEVTVTDEDKSFDYLGKCLTGRMDTSDMGLNIVLVSFWKDRYKDNIPLELRSEILNKFNKTFDEIEGILLKK
jgi:hypothetical protein